MINGFNSKQVNRYIDIEMVWKLMVSVCMYPYVNSIVKISAPQRP